MKRIILICEGPTEQAFTKTNLQVPFISKNIYIQSPLIKASRGGIVKWSKLKEQIETHLKAEPTAYVTTFIDYYGMYDKYLFPQWVEVCSSMISISSKVKYQKMILWVCLNLKKHLQITIIQK